MKNYEIITDSSCDLSASMINELDVNVLPLSFHINNHDYMNYVDDRQIINDSEFYNLLRQKHTCTTSAVNMEAYIKFIEPMVQQGKDILCICFSSGLSATYQAASAACNELSEKYPERKILVCDSLAASLGQGLLVWYAANMRISGKSIEDVRKWLEDEKLHLCHWFTVNDLFFLKRGGRVSSAAAVFGTMLGIKPVMHVDNEGHLIAVSKSRGRKASLDALVDNMEKTAINPAEQMVFISHGDCIEDAKYIEKEVKKRFNTKNVFINTVGPVIGAHSGPGTVALFYIGTIR